MRFLQVITTLIVLANFVNGLPSKTITPIFRVESNSENTGIPSFIRRSATFLTADSLGLLSLLEDQAGRHGFRYRSVRVMHVKRRQFKRASFKQVLDMF